MKILIETIAHSSQRYDTCGDWTVSPEGNWMIKVSSLHNWRREALVAVHELVEMILCRDKGLTAGAVDDFDLGYQQDLQHLAECNDPDCPQDHDQLRKRTLTEEPGDCPESPYYIQHQIATVVERLLAAQMNIEWEAYSNQIANLKY